MRDEPDCLSLKLSLTWLAIAMLAVAVPKPAVASHNFTIQGQFTCTAQGVTMPVEGAIVGIMRDKAWAVDPIVTEVQTAADGSFSAQVNAKDVDSYYAKLFLNDKEGVFLHDWWTLNIREYNSASRGRNKTGFVDLGGTDISRDGGRGTPQCAVWQGGRRAWKEYVAVTGQRPLIGDQGNYQITMESTASGIIWTSRDTTHWEIGNGTGEYSNIVAPADPQHLTYDDLFHLYGTNVHEFGHALRHTADGGENHFTWDATRFFYGHNHGLCDSSPTGIQGNNGYGFNEGWADYWQASDEGDLRDCIKHGVGATNFQQESAVAFDLESLQNALGPCAGISAATTGDELIRRRRALMFATLSGAGHEKIHSESDFRSAWSQRFPTCVAPAAGTLSATVTIPVGAYAHVPFGLWNDPRLTAARASAASFPTAIAEADHAAKGVTTGLPRDQQLTLLTRPVLLRSQAAYANLIEERLSSVTIHPSSPATLMTGAGEKRRAAEVALFDNRARAITLNLLTEERATLVKRNSPAFADDIGTLDAQIADVRSGKAVTPQTLLGSDVDTIKANGAHALTR